VSRDHAVIKVECRNQRFWLERGVAHLFSWKSVFVF
jgi:hypothetical protein